MDRKRKLSERHVSDGEMIRRIGAEIEVGLPADLVKVKAHVLTALIPGRELREGIIRRELTELVKGGSSIACYGPKRSLPFRPLGGELTVSDRVNVFGRIDAPVPGTGKSLPGALELLGEGFEVHGSDLSDYIKRAFATNELHAWEMLNFGRSLLWEQGAFTPYNTTAAQNRNTHKPTPIADLRQFLKEVFEPLAEREKEMIAARDRDEKFREGIKKWAESPDMVLYFAGGIASDTAKYTLAEILEKYPGHRGRIRRNAFLEPDTLMLIDEENLQSLYRWASGGGLEEKIMANSHLKSYGKKRAPKNGAKRTWYYSTEFEGADLVLNLEIKSASRLYRSGLRLMPCDLHYANVPARRIIAEAWWRLRLHVRLEANSPGTQ